MKKYKNEGRDPYGLGYLLRTFGKKYRISIREQGTGEKYRNPPLWGVPLEMKRRLPHVKMLGDPSHIAGRREYIPRLAQQARVELWQRVGAVVGRREDRQRRPRLPCSR